MIIEEGLQMMSTRDRCVVSVLFSGLTAIVFLWPPVAKAQKNIHVRIDHYTHNGCVIDGKRLKPAFAHGGEASFFWLPRQRQTCVETIKRSWNTCAQATSFISNTENEKYAECLPIFAAEYDSCAAHYSATMAKCEQIPESKANVDERELDDERERMELEKERERLALEEERERLALEEERKRLQKEQRLAEEQERQRLAEERREPKRQMLAEERRRRELQKLTRQRMERARRLEQQRREQERLRAQRQNQSDAAAAMGFLRGFLSGAAEMRESGNAGMAMLKGLAGGLGGTAGSGDVARNSVGTGFASGVHGCTPLPPACANISRRGESRILRFQNPRGMAEATRSRYCMYKIGIEVNRFCAQEYRNLRKSQCASLSEQQAQAYQNRLPLLRQRYHSVAASGYSLTCN